MLGWAVVLFIGALASQHCTSKPTSATTTAATPAAPSLDSSLAPTLSVKELMEHIIDPTADWIFDAAVIDISHKGVTETKPLTEEDWLKVERGGWLLAESTNLLKIPRRIVPVDDEGKPHQPGDPELLAGPDSSQDREGPGALVQARRRAEDRGARSRADCQGARYRRAVQGRRRRGSRRAKPVTSSTGIRATARRCSSIRTAKSLSTRPRRSSRQAHKSTKPRDGRVDRASGLTRRTQRRSSIRRPLNARSPSASSFPPVARRSRRGE